MGWSITFLNFRFWIEDFRFLEFVPICFGIRVCNVTKCLCGSPRGISFRQKRYLFIHGIILRGEPRGIPTWPRLNCSPEALFHRVNQLYPHVRNLQCLLCALRHALCTSNVSLVSFPSCTSRPSWSNSLSPRRARRSRSLDHSSRQDATHVFFVVVSRQTKSSFSAPLRWIIICVCLRKSAVNYPFLSPSFGG